MAAATATSRSCSSIFTLAVIFILVGFNFIMAQDNRFRINVYDEYQEETPFKDYPDYQADENYRENDQQQNPNYRDDQNRNENFDHNQHQNQNHQSHQHLKQNYQDVQRPNENYQEDQQRNQDYQGVQDQNKNFPVVFNQNKNFPVVEIQNKNFPVVEIQNKNFPVVQIPNKNIAVVQIANKNFPVVQNQNKNFPVVQNQNKNFPVVQNQNKNFPVVQNQNKNFPVVRNQNKNHPGTQHRNKNHHAVEILNQNDKTTLSQYQKQYREMFENLKADNLKSSTPKNKPKKEGQDISRIPGIPGIDFPIYHTIPKTSFSCSLVPFLPGMYANVETGCQVYHVCHDGREGDQGASFLCTNGTLFNQIEFACDWWYNVKCHDSFRSYSLNGDATTNPFVPKAKQEEILKGRGIDPNLKIVVF